MGGCLPQSDGDNARDSAEAETGKDQREPA